MWDSNTYYYIYPPGESPPKDNKIENDKLWMEQSRLFWSRLQTATAVQTGIFIGWYKVDNADLKNGILWLGVLLLACVFIIMIRDGSYIKILKERMNCPNEIPIGRIFGRIMVGLLILSNLILLVAQIPPTSNQSTGKEIEELKQKLSDLELQLHKANQWQEEAIPKIE